jgi:hypothetical protein
MYILLYPREPLEPALFSSYGRVPSQFNDPPQRGMADTLRTQLQRCQRFGANGRICGGGKNVRKEDSLFAGPREESRSATPPCRKASVFRWEGTHSNGGIAMAN